MRYDVDRGPRNPTTLDPWLEANSRADMDEYRRETEGGMRVVAYGLLVIAFATFVGIALLAGWLP